MVEIKEVVAKSIITKSKLPDTDYVINPYTGCQFGCMYCYASFMGRWIGKKPTDRGNYVSIKTNAVELAQKELATRGDKKRQSTILLSSVTDPYQGVEKQYQLTRGIVQALVDAHYPGCISILTKSPLVLRDIDLLQQLEHVEIGMTVTTTDDDLGAFLELDAPYATARFDALCQLHDAGLSTYAFVGPLLPHYRYETVLLDELFGRLAGCGVSEIYVEHINMSAYIMQRLQSILAQLPPPHQQAYQEVKDPQRRTSYNDFVYQIAQRHGLCIRLDGAMYHPELP